MVTVLEDQSYKYNYSNYLDVSLIPSLKHQEKMITSYIQNDKLTPELKSELLTKKYSKLRALKRELDKRGIIYEV